MTKNDKIKTYLIVVITFILISVITTPAKFSTNMLGKTHDCDVPTWYEGDEWIYTADPVHYSGDFGSFIGIIENLKQKVIGITDIIHNEISYEVYEIEILGDISGIFTYSDVSGNLEGDIVGTSYIRVSDLAQLKTEIYSYGTIQLIFIYLDYETSFITSMNPPVELYDYPINLDEQWIITSDSISSGSFYLEGLVNESFSRNMSINNYMECIDKENVNVPAGTFECYELFRENNSIWYSSEIENNVKSEMQYSDENNTFFATLSLISYSRSIQPIIIDLDISPDITMPYEPVILSGQAIESDTGNPVQNEIINIEIPRTGDSWNVSTDTNGEYTKTISAPLIIDDTPSINEIGSDGVVVNYNINNILGHRIKTLVIVENDVPNNPIIIGETNGNYGEEYEYIFIATDPNDNDLWFYIEWGDNTFEEWIGPYDSGEELYISHLWGEKGTYLLRAKVKDIYNCESNWSTFEVNMPINQLVSTQFVFRFFERFQNSFPVIRFLFGL